jgi:hypothetical protein
MARISVKKFTGVFFRERKTLFNGRPDRTFEVCWQQDGKKFWKTFNDFVNLPSVRGDTSYVVGGLLSRFGFANHGSGSFYLELTARAGRVSTDFMSLDFLPVRLRPQQLLFRPPRRSGPCLQPQLGHGSGFARQIFLEPPAGQERFEWT